MSMDYIKEFREEVKSLAFKRWDKNLWALESLAESFITKVANDAEAKGRDDAVDYIRARLSLKEVVFEELGEVGNILESARNTQV